MAHAALLLLISLSISVGPADSGDFLVFKNEINSFENPNEVITRRSQVKIGFFCQYPKVASVSNHYINKKSDYIFTESSFGTFSYTFDIFTNNNFSSRVDPSLYPLEENLMDMLYMGIAAHSALPEVRLFVESCRALQMTTHTVPYLMTLSKKVFVPVLCPDSPWLLFSIPGYLSWTGFTTAQIIKP
ncbi:hypothetical protein G5714_023711 [Onychostoma macrolepis]|uniref:ZP-C domain-containing protein n=1 Tax=Onychostoma macrolepis TaxID=369639 RepID=A0A7J6BM58_9TELE|nr:hypothetical protein G5714_023711 [Onychostoma macrolepis]